MISLTVFKNQYDNETNKKLQFEDWNSLVKMFATLSTRPGKKGGKNSSELISPAKYNEGTTRANANVECWDGWCALDVDEWPCNEDVKSSVDEVIGDYQYLIYSTASSSKEQPKFRLCLPLTQPVPADKIKHFWFALNSEFKGLADKQTKDLSRMFYIPAQYPNAYNFFFENVGEVIDPNKLMDKWEYIEPTGNSFLDSLSPEMREQVMEYKRNQLTNTSYSWTSYLDCPFIPKSMIAEYKATTGTGWYRKMYQIMVAMALNAIEKGYPITEHDIVRTCKTLDNDTGKWYENRPFHIEASRALQYAFSQT